MGGNLASWTCKACRSPEGFGPISFYGDFTQCFIDGVILNLSALFMLAFGTRDLLRLCKERHPGVKYRRNWIIVFRMALVLLEIVFVSLASLNLSNDETRNFTIVSQYASTMLSLFVALALHWIEYHRSVVANTILLFYWLFETFGNFAKLINIVIRHSYEGEWYLGKTASILTLFQVITCAGILLLEALPKKPLMPHQRIHQNLTRRKPNPYDSANIFSRITFSWMSSLMKTGYEKYLVEADLYKLPKNFNSAELSQKLEKNWQSELKQKSKPSLSWAICKTFGRKMLLAASFKAIHDILAFTQPQLLRILIKFVTDYNNERQDDDNSSILGFQSNHHQKLPIVRGFMIAFAMFLVGFTQTSVLHQYFLNVFNTGMYIKSALTALIYQKSLVLSNEASGLSSTGDIVNLMSVDVQKIQDLTQWLNLIWSGPFQIIICLYSLYKLLGNSMWVGVIILVIMMPLNSFLMRIQKKLQKSQMKYKDERTVL